MANTSPYNQFPKCFPFTFLKSLCLVLEGFRATSEAFWGLDGAFTRVLQINSKHSHKKASAQVESTPGYTRSVSDVSCGMEKPHYSPSSITGDRLAITAAVP